MGIRDHADPARPDKLFYLAKDPTLTAPTRGGADDPTIEGASFTVRNPNTSESVTYALPAFDGDIALWQTNTAGSVFRYRNQRAPAGPSAVKRAKIKNGLLKVVLVRDLEGFTLDESQQGVIDTVFTSGSTTWCSHFDAPRRDVGTVSGALGLFIATNAPAPAACDAIGVTAAAVPACGP